VKGLRNEPEIPFFSRKRKRKRDEEVEESEEYEHSEEAIEQATELEVPTTPNPDPTARLKELREYATTVRSEFRMNQALVLQSPDNYYALLRTDLGSTITTHIQIQPLSILFLEVKTVRIYASEMVLTRAWKDVGISMPREAVERKLVHVSLPMMLCLVVT
jgi:hypothetical protein